MYISRDFDGDGESDWHCRGGSDCDDFDPAINTSAAELCYDGRDNDCDDQVDEDSCGGPEHDTCEDALDISEGGVFELRVAGAAADQGLSCAAGSMPDVVATFEVAEPRDVHLTVRGLRSDGTEQTVSVAVRQACDDPASELECVAQGLPGHVRMRAVPTGRYFAIVSPNSYSTKVERIVLTANFGEATAPPENTLCQTAEDISGGGRFAGSFVDVSDDYSAPCGVPAVPEGTTYRQPDVVYMFTLNEPQNVSLAAVTLTGDPITLSVRSDCGDETSTLRCERNAPAAVVLHELPSGTYYVILESPVVLEADFELDMRLSPPTAPPPGDDCAHPQLLELGAGEITADLLSKQDRVRTSCGFNTADTVFQFSLEREQDLAVAVESRDQPTIIAIQAPCDAPERELACELLVNDRKFAVRGLPPGEYFLIVESLNAPEINLTVTATEHIVPLPVTGNDRCENAYVVPPSGGVFAGNTAELAHDYLACNRGSAADAVYRLDLAESAEVRVELEAEFDGVLYRYAAGATPETCFGPVAECRDDLRSTEVLEETLPSGSYYYVIDGATDGQNGPYQVRFEIQ